MCLNNKTPALHLDTTFWQVSTNRLETETIVYDDVEGLVEGWHHFAIVRDTETQTLNLYIDANKVGERELIDAYKLYYNDEAPLVVGDYAAKTNSVGQILNLDTYTHLKNTFKDKFIVKGYFLEGKLVGFLSAMQNDSHLDAHFIGIDYANNKDYAIYPRILNDYVRLGIETKSDQINLGRTASEIKSTLGATPKALTCYCKHKRSIPNQILKPFIKNAHIKSFRQHSPFK